MPGWLNDVFLGYGDPKSAVEIGPFAFASLLHHFIIYSLLVKIAEIDFAHTFVSKEHLEASFGGKSVQFAQNVPLLPPFKVHAFAIMTSWN